MLSFQNFPLIVALLYAPPPSNLWRFQPCSLADKKPNTEHGPARCTNPLSADLSLVPLSHPPCCASPLLCPQLSDQWACEAHPSGSCHAAPRSPTVPDSASVSFSNLCFPRRSAQRSACRVSHFCLSRRSRQCIYQSNHHRPDVRVWVLSHFSLLDNLLISFPSSTRFILIKVLSVVTQAVLLGCAGKTWLLTFLTP